MNRKRVAGKVIKEPNIVVAKIFTTLKAQLRQEVGWGTAYTFIDLYM